MQQPAKWRETVDLTSLCLEPFRVKEILGYPHAGNDVFYVSGWDGERPCRAFVKVERQKGADVLNEAATLRRLSLPYLPRVLAVGEQTPRFLVTEEMPGDRLSVIGADRPGAYGAAGVGGAPPARGGSALLRPWRLPLCQRALAGRARVRRAGLGAVRLGEPGV